MQISFENEYGKITIGGGEHPLWNATKITGVGLPAKTYNTVTYAARDGQRTIAETATARTITIGGDIRNDGGLQRELTRAVKILHHSGVLKIRSGRKKRKIECRCTGFDTDSRNGAAQLFVMQFVCDSPYFSDFTLFKTAIYEREELIGGEFTLPMAFTNRTSEIDVVNYGDIKTAPVITLYDTTNLPSEENTSEVIAIYNETTNQHIKLNYSTSGGEEIVIDLPNRKITSSVSGNIISRMTADTFLNDFWLEAGVNHIAAYSAKSIAAVMEYSNRYAEAI